MKIRKLKGERGVFTLVAGGREEKKGRTVSS